MEGYMVVIAVLVIVAAVFGCTIWLMPYLVKKGIDISGILSGASAVTETTGTLIDGLQEYFPENKVISVIDTIVDWAKIGVAKAEQLYKVSTIEADQRKESATELVYSCLAEAGIEVNDNIRKIVDGAIEAAVQALPKTHVTTEVTTATPENTTPAQ